jgi:hypothetical protein
MNDDDKVRFEFTHAKGCVNELFATLIHMLCVVCSILSGA